MDVLRKIYDRMFSPGMSGLYTLFIASAIGIATFIENDYGTPTAQKLVYRAHWFEILLLLFAISIVSNIFRYRMIQNKKWTILTFHLSIIVILAGSAVTRFFGSEGMMSIREGATADQFMSDETYLSFDIMHGNKKYRIDEPIHLASLGSNSFMKSYNLDGEVLNFELLHFIPNPIEEIVSDPNGNPVMQMTYSWDGGRRDLMLKFESVTQLGANTLYFGERPQEGAINLLWRNGKLTMSSPLPMSQFTMANQERTLLNPNEENTLMVRTLYSGEGFNFVISDFRPKGLVLITPASKKITASSLNGMQLKASTNQNTRVFEVYGSKGLIGRKYPFKVGNFYIDASYGSILKNLPFALKLNDFIIEKYPGTNSASSYASEVTLMDPRNDVEKDHRIFMNNILNYDGYRFFQSSYDRDEKGTVLSVNHDFWGTWISYFGYFLLTLGMALAFFSKKSRFQALVKKLRYMQSGPVSKAAILILFISTISFTANAEAVINGPWRLMNQEHIENLNTILVQDHNGRYKPYHTLANELIRKISKKQELYGMSSQHILTSMLVYPEEWKNIPLIKMAKHPEIKKILNTEEELLSYNDFFLNEYLLTDYVSQAYDKDAKERGVFEKEIIKLDEKVNICNLLFTTRLIKIFPIYNDPDGPWYTPVDASSFKAQDEMSVFMRTFFTDYTDAIKYGVTYDDWSKADQLLNELKEFQRTNGGENIPSQNKVDREIQLNELNVFSKLGMYYGLIGLVSLILFFISVFNHKVNMKWPKRILTGVVIVLFVFHAIGLGLRWYVSGHAPWSNGYESMIYIGWTTILAGLIFARKSLGGITATLILASTILMVAWLSYMDPEITPLVPVLKSYWLTIHVSLIAGSYGFLMLGAILGVLNLILMIFANQNNGKKIYKTIKEMTIISEMTLLGGLFMIAVGTYLGGVWANESWGRYWGWDAKETWALVTILIYTFILHMRFIPGLKNMYAFNLATLFGWASVIMTYFGVNYYLSGLHSYASGDPVPIPPFVYYSVAALTIISILAYFKNRKLNFDAPI